VDLHLGITALLPTADTVRRQGLVRLIKGERYTLQTVIRPFPHMTEGPPGHRLLCATYR